MVGMVDDISVDSQWELGQSHDDLSRIDKCVLDRLLALFRSFGLDVHVQSVMMRGSECVAPSSID